MFNKKMLAASMAVAITTGGMVAQSHAIEVTNNDIGQVLLGPVFYAENGYTTDITVTNTRTDAAVKAKVVFRSHAASQEILDFIIYLSPADVWRGQVVTGSNGEGHILSSDDSMRNSTDDDWANNDPVDQTFFSQALEAGDSTTFGHFEVIGVYAAAETYSTSDAGTVVVEQGMSKDDLKAIFDDADAGVIGRQIDYEDCFPGQLNDPSLDPEGTVSSISPCSLQLMGEVIIGSTNDPNRASHRTTALGTSEPALINDEVSAEANNYVITNPFFNATTGAESLIGTNFGVIGEACEADNIACIERALAGDTTQYEYESDADEATHTAIVFPTKYRHRDGDSTACGVGDAESDEYTPPFQPTEVGEMRYTYTSLNNSEEGATESGSSFSGGPTSVAASFPNEVNYHYTMGNFAESGWAYYSWDPESGCAYQGAPVIGYSYKFRPGATSTETMLQRAPNSTRLELAE